MLARGLGTLNAAVAVGGTISLFLRPPQRVRREPLLGAAFVVYGLSLLALGSSRSLIVATGILVVNRDLAPGRSMSSSRR